MQGIFRYELAFWQKRYISELMIIYLERQAKDYPLVKHILARFSDAEILEIDHYKNIFDKNIIYPTMPCLILAKQTNPSLTPTPPNYGYPGKSFFFKTALNCIFDCEYCYLKGAFKNKFPVIFVNYEEIKKKIDEEIKGFQTLPQPLPCQGGERKHEDTIYFYASNYSDGLAMEELTHFVQEFVPFFENFEHVMMEVRTKSGITPSHLITPPTPSKIEGATYPPKNTEIAYSLNPQEIIEEYEHGTATLDERIKAINARLDAGRKVGLRFLPLLPVENYQEIYEKFLQEVKTKVHIKKIHSMFMAPIIYTKEDWKQIQKKQPDLSYLKAMHECEDGFVRVEKETIEAFQDLFTHIFPEQNIYFDIQ